MDPKELKEKALEISNKYPFSEFRVAASADNKTEGDAKVSSCDNHLDMDFMKLLDQGVHLDTERMPL
jgi:hypothetical protein